MSAIVWSEDLKIELVNETLLLRPDTGNRIREKLSSIVTVVYQHPKGASGDDWTLYALQRGAIYGVQQLFPLDGKPGTQQWEETQKWNGMYNSFLNHGAMETGHGRLMVEKFDKEGNLIIQYGETKPKKTSCILHAEPIKSIAEKESSRQWRDILGEQTPLSIIEVKGKSKIKYGGLCGVRIFYGIESELSERDTVPDCPWFENLCYDILMPKAVHSWISGKYEQQILEAEQEGKDRKQLEKIVQEVRTELEQAQRHSPLVHRTGKQNGCAFELLLAGMHSTYRYTPGYDSSVFVRKAPNLVPYGVNGTSGEAMIIYARPDNLEEPASFALIAQKKPTKEARCGAGTPLDDRLKAIETELQGLKTVGTTLKEQNNLLQDVKAQVEQLQKKTPVDTTGEPASR